MSKKKNQPVYPKSNPEYDAWRKEHFLKQVKRTNWDYDPDEYQGKPRGRKVKFKEKPKAKPRKGEKYDWFEDEDDY